MKRTVDRSVRFTHSDTTDTILLGATIGTFEHEGMKGDVCGAGKTLRIHVDGKSGYVDIDLAQAVRHALLIMRAIELEKDGA